MLAMQRRAVARVARFSTAAATQEATSSANLPLRVELRETEGSRAARRLRKQGFLPGILYGEGVDGAADKVLVSLETRAFEKLHRKLWTSVENQVFDLQVGDRAAPVKAYMRDLQLDPVTDAPIAVNFMRFKPGRTLTIPITYLNEEGSPGLKRGGYINHIHHELECTIYTDAIPATLQIDVNGLHVGDKIYLDAIEFPEGIVPAIPAGSMVSKIAGRRGLIPRIEPVAAVAEDVVQQEDETEEEFDEWNDIF
ncbi:Ribosomal protein l25, ctc-form [Globisporangium polare]